MSPGPTTVDKVTIGELEADANGEEKVDLKVEVAAPPQVGKVTIKELFRFADGLDIVMMVFGSIGAAVFGGVMPFFSILFGDLLNALYAPNPQAAISKVALDFVYLGIVSCFAHYAGMAFWMQSAERQIRRIREQSFSAIMKQEIGWFDRTGTGELCTHMSSDTILIQDGLGDQFSSIIRFEMCFVLGFAFGFWRGWQLTLVILSVTPLLAIAGAIFMKFLTGLAAQGQAAYANAGNVATEVFAAMRTVASFASEPKVIEKYGERLETARQVGIKKGFVTGLSIGATMFVLFGSYALALWYGATLIADGKYTPGDVMSVFFSVLIGAMALGQAAPGMTALGNAQGAAWKLWQIIDRVPLIDSSSEEGKKLEELKGRIEFKNVKFRYPSRPDAEIFSDFSLKIKPGKTVALVGTSGSGKSTTIQLLERFYDPEQGAVYLDGEDIRDLNIKWLRQQMGLVGQEPVLFSGTIGENISYGQDATQEEIEAAAHSANAHRFISKFPDGYKTEVGEKGAKLSGGQKQRIAIARAILKNPRILLLDEATSALDTQSEKVVQEALDRARQGRTTIVIAHRLATIRDADKIIVLDRGQVVESGTHNQLIEKEGQYYQLVQLQGMGKNDSLGKHGSQRKKRHSRVEEHHEEVDIDEVKIEDPAAKELKPEEKMKEVSIFRVFAMNKPEFPLYILGFIGAILNGGIMPVFAIIFSEMTIVFFKPPDEMRKGAALWAIIFLCIGIASLIGNLLQNGFFGLAGEKLTHRLRVLGFQAILRKDIGFFDHENHSTGVLTARLATDTTLVQGMLGTRLALGVQNGVTIAGGLGIAFYYGWKLTLVVLAVSPLLAFGEAMNMLLLKGFKARDAANKANGLATEAISNVRTVASFTNEAFVRKIYVDCLQGPQKEAIRKAHTIGGVMGFGQFMLFSAEGLAFWYGGTLIASGEMDGGTFMKVFMAILMAAMSVGQSTSFMPDMGKAKVAAAGLFDLIDNIPAIDSFSEEGTRVEKIGGRIELRDVVFRYPTRPDTVILKNLNLVVEPGHIVALVGESGCGKSSIVSLIERFYDVEDGALLVDGQDIREYNLRSLRRQIGLVGQEPVLFSGTISQNIAYGVEHATQEQIEEAAQASNAHKFIMKFPAGYDTDVGEKGAQLSGGQKQRVAIARAILKNPSILLLDEATSALDSESERKVQAALDTVMKGRTTIVVAHRLSTIKHADQIAVVDKGVISELGTHDELMALNGRYYALVKRQT